MKLINLSSALIFILINVTAFSQGTIRGVVKDAKTNEPIYGVMIRVDGTGKAKTDFDGAYNIKLNEGKYVLTFSNEIEGYIDQTKEIDLKDGAIEVVDIVLTKDKSVQQIEDITVVGVKTTGGTTTIAATDKKRMEENSSTDGLPKEQITNSGVPSAAEAVQMIPAASVQDGKNVFIRGLGDRYSKTILNGMDIPGLDPDRNSVQLDIFPAVLIDNITVYKTFTPNLAGDFTGGLVDITTKDFPARKTIYAKFSAGYNTQSTFNKDFISYDGGKFDFIGFDDGTRKLPVNPNVQIPHPANQSEQTTKLTSAFSDVMSTRGATSFLNQSYSFAIGNQRTNDKMKSPLTYGYNFAINYTNNNVFYSDAQYNEYRKDNDKSVNELYIDRASTGQVAQNDILWTVLFGQSIKIKNSKINLNVFHTQNGISSAANITQVNSESNPATIVKQSLTYNQRSISNANLNGVHFLGEKKNWKFNWKVSPTYSKISDPDMRTTALEKVTAEDGTVTYELNQAVGAEIRRTFRELKEYNVGARGDFSYTFKQWNALPSDLSFGIYNTYKHRSFDVDDYTFNVKGPADESGNPDWYFDEQNVWNLETNQGVYASGQKEMANIYEATQNISAVYLMNELPLTKNFNATYGARVEKNMNFYTGQSNNAEFDPNAPRYLNKKVLDVMNVLPSINLVYKVRNQKDSLHTYERNANIRAAYTQTVARPSFREISISQIYDPIQGRRYIGNINLKQTLIHNADLRYEYFFGRTELISASVFYKKFINPIEVVANVAAPNELKPVNAGEADLYGAEVELRKAIGFKNNDKVALTFGFNFTYNVSRIDMRKVETEIGGETFTEKEVRESNAREGETIGNYRSMYGQSPYVVNSYLTFQHNPSFTMVNLSYNVQGKRLSVIGVGTLPDVYEQPFHGLSLKVSKKFGKINTELKENEPRWSASLQGQNLLNNKKRMFYESYEAKSQVYQYLNPGTTISLSIAYSIR